MNQPATSTARTAPPTRNLVAVLGPTNTGKTHLAIERMLAHSSGVIGLPLRLLAREVYNRVADRVGADQVALITGEEKIVPPAPRFRVCTVEAMPNEADAAFLAVDEIQLAGDLERGHVFTDRILNLRGRDETLLLGAATMRGIIEKLLPGINVVTRPRMSLLTYAGSKKITRLPRRSAVVAFSADEVYAIAELIRRQRGGAAVVLGSLSPRTRNAQVELFQSGDVDFLVATDAIGMGLNLDVDHVAFASDRKFDGYQFRRLTAAELAQIAGRAGRHIRDGTFGVTSRVGSFEDALVEAIESHRFDAVKTVQWRNRDLDFASLRTLKDSLDRAPDREGLTKAPISEDVAVLDIACRDGALTALADTPARVALLWDVCQIPDYRKIAPANHAEMVATIFGFLARDGAIADDWFARQVAFADRTDGDIDTLANRIAHIRTWTFAANRPQWLADPYHWQERTRAIEDRLSDALHERLTARFVDRRTSVLMRRLKENAMLEAEITGTGDVLVEGQHVGSLQGFRFLPDQSADGPDGKALRAAAQKALAGEFSTRAEKVATATNEDLILSIDGTLRWQGNAIARLVEGDDRLKPRLILLADETLAPADRERVQGRIDLWLANRAETLLKPLFDLAASNQLSPPARGIAFRLVENFGAIDRAAIADEIRALDQEARAGMRALGVRFGAYHIHVPALLKPAPSALLATLWALKNGGVDQPGLADLAGLAASGRTSLPVDATIPAPLYRIVGYSIAGTRAVRIDILERLADLIRPLIAWRSPPDGAPPPEGAVPGNGFTVTVAMTSLLGCSGEDFSSVLRALGYRMERRPAPPVAAPESAADAAGGRTGNGAAETEATPAASNDNSAAPDIIEAGPEREADPPTPDGETDQREPDGNVAPSHPVTSPVAGIAGQEEVAASGEQTAVSEPAATGQAAVSAESASDGAEASDSAAAAEPAFIEVWRPGRRDRPRPRRDRPATTAQPDRHEQAAGRPSVSGQPADKRQSRSQKPRKRKFDGPRQPSPRKPPAEKRADPDSPFAALAALKAQLEGKDEGR
jgi:ATP-dependent RNA helicase SUPV3L1/SUV3